MYQCNLKLYELIILYAKFKPDKQPELSWNFCWKFVGAKYGFILDEIKLLHWYSGLDVTKESETLAISKYKNKKKIFNCDYNRMA